MSFFSSFLGGGGDTARKYVDRQNGLINDTTNLAGGLTTSFNTAAQQGAWDPNAQLDQLKADTAYQTKVNTDNAASAARVMGYRPGDTAPLQNMQAMNNQSQLQYADEANRIRTGALQAGYQAAASLANEKAGLYGQAMGANGGLLNYAEQQDQQSGAMLSGLLGTALPFLGGLGKKSTPKPTMPTGGWSAYGLMPDDLVQLGILQGPDRDNPFYR